MMEAKAKLGTVIDAIRELDSKDQADLLKFLQSTLGQAETSDKKGQTERPSRRASKRKQAMQADVVAALKHLGVGATLQQIWQDIRIRQSKPFALPKDEAEGCQWVLNRISASPKRLTECPGGGYQLLGQQSKAPAA
jgi:hypothetical protein